MALKWRDYLGLSRWAQCNCKSPFKQNREPEDSVSERRNVKKKQKTKNEKTQLAMMTLKGARGNKLRKAGSL